MIKMAIMNMVEALNSALFDVMQKNPNVVILGEDVAKDGGVFRVTDNLWKKYPNRVFDTPLAESGILGASIGLSLNGIKPVAEIQFEGFTFPAIDQIINHATRIRNRSRGRFTPSLVLRSPFGGGVKALEHHSDSPETYYAHVPGLKLVIPSHPYDAEGLLISSIKDNNPVVFFEPKKIYRLIINEAPRFLNYSAEIISIINEKCFKNLKHHIERVTGFDTVIPMPKHEEYYLPNKARIKYAIEKVMS